MDATQTTTAAQLLRSGHATPTEAVALVNARRSARRNGRTVFVGYAGGNLWVATSSTGLDVRFAVTSDRAQAAA